MKDKKHKKGEARVEQSAPYAGAMPSPPRRIADADGVTEAEARRGVRRWLRPVMQSIDHDRIVAATKSSLLIAVNALMLSVTALSLFRAPPGGSRWWALVPLALTNIVSLAFATFSAQAGERPVEEDEWWAQEAEAHEVQRWEQARRMLAAEVEARGAALSAARLYLRTAYRVLLGGIVVTAVTFGASLAMSARLEALAVRETAAACTPGPDEAKVAGAERASDPPRPRARFEPPLLESEARSQ